jgi:hypothetical protein
LQKINKNLKEKITIPDEAPNIAKESGILIVSARHIEFSFKEEKTKEVKIVSSKKRFEQ